ncbi:MAG TPA: NrfD/PsrC family molybdoenzyme membrane anchor subunit [Terriglobales bacterium]|nr:NrfD/PsrC family molybdoenzyme membrane anchor subunit [Terriglobales bacterium]
MTDSALPSRLQVTDPDVSFQSRERRLEAIRLEAARTGHVEAIGARPAGSPIPIASVETGYYGIPMLKEPQWSWEIPVYFFVGGAAGAAAVIAEFAQMIGAETEVVNDARTVAAIGAILSPALLVSDLGVPSRFLNMLRVFKVQSPMSVGVYIVSLFGPSVTAAKIVNSARRNGSGTMLKIIEGTAGLFAALTGLGMATYTGVLIGATAIPVWNENIDTLPTHFALSGLAAGVSAIQLMGHEESRALNILGIAASAGETLEGMKIEIEKKPASEAIKKGLSGAITRLGGVLSGPLPLALRLAAIFTKDSRSKNLVRAASAASLAGSLLTRVGWMRAGHSSARDYRLPLQIPAGSSKVEASHAQSMRAQPRPEGLGERSYERAL